MVARKLHNLVSKQNVIRFAILVAFVALIITLVVIFWPEIHKLTEPDGLQRMLDQLRGVGPGGALALFGIQIVQVMLGFIPSEILAIAAGIMYGPWLGILIVILGCAAGTTIVFFIVRKLGAPFVRSVVPQKYMDKFNHFEQSDNFYRFVFILFLIPGIPKDVVTYIVPLSTIRLVPFVTVATLGRLPELFAVTYAASDIANGNYIEALVIFAITACVAIAGLILYTRFEKRITH